MRLTCPECGAQYEIENELIPPEGRSVQCSVCEHVWREMPSGPSEARPAGAPAARKPPEPDTRSDGAPPPEMAPSGASERAPAARRPMADVVRAILRQEADRESRVRRERGLVEIQPDLKPSPASAGPARRRRPGSGALPDPEKINEALRAASQRASELHHARTRRPARGGFLAGLLVGLCLVGLAALLYVTAPRIADAVSEAEPALQGYVAAVDDVRVALDRAADRLLTAALDLME